jgi:hypothetical protein
MYYLLLLVIKIFVNRDTEKLKFLESNYQCTCMSLSLKFLISYMAKNI